MQVMKHKWLVVLLGCYLLCFGVYGQQLLEDDLLLNTGELVNPDLNGSGNEAFITQIGNDNDVGVIQELGGNNSSNVVRVLQAGDANIAQINQEGFLNQTILLQDGNNNLYTLSLEGSENTFVIKQLGNDNVINQQLTNTTQMYIELIQEGNNNEITHIQDGLSSHELIIRQVGNGLKMQIIQSDQ